MKHTTLYLCLIALLAISCNQSNTYKISGTWEDGDGKVVYLKKVIDDKQSLVIDSAVVKGETFKMSGPIKQIDKRVLSMGKNEETILLDNEPIQVTVTRATGENGEKLDSYTVDLKGSPEQAIFKEAKQLFMTKALLSLGSMFAMVNVKDDSIKLDSVYKATEMMKKAVDDEIKHFIDSCNNSMAITYIIGEEVAREYPIEDVDHFYNNLTPEVKASYPGQLLAKKIETLRSINVGGIAPEIEQAAPDGTIIKLSSLRGKYVLLDFWASWCGPCLAEVPNVKAIYDDYKDKGFEIYGVSLDDDKAAWENAIKKHGLNWLHVSSLKGWECPVAKRYNVTGIPRMYLLDPEGRIIAMDLRGQALRDKVASLFPDASAH